MAFSTVKPIASMRTCQAKAAPFRSARSVTRGFTVVRSAADERPVLTSSVTAAALAAALLFAPVNPACADGGVVQTGPNFNAGLQAGQRQAAANTQALGSAPTGEVKKNSPMVPSATKQTAQPGSLFRGLAKGASDTLKESFSETAAAQAFKDDPATANKVNTQKGYLAVKDLAKRVGQDPSPEEAAARTGTQGGDAIKGLAKRIKANE